MKPTGKRWLITMLSCIVFLTLGATEALALSVTGTVPKGEVKDLTQITVRVTDPMRALGVMEQQAEGAPLRLSASGGKLPSGNFRWLDQATLAYVFDAPVSVPLSVAASVPAGARSLAGKTLIQGVSWTISPPPLALEIYNQKNIRLPRKNAVFYLQANYPLNISLLRAKLQITQGGKTLPFSVGAASPAAWTGERPSRWRYAVTIKSDLPPNSPVTVTVAQGITAKDGGMPAEKFTAEIAAYTPLRLEAWLFDGDKAKDPAKNIRPETRFSISLNNPAQAREIFRHIAITPEPELFSKDIYDGETAHLLLPYIWKPRTTYAVTLKKGLKDAYGTVMPKDETLTFTTGDYLPLMHVPGGSDAVVETPLADIFPVTLRNTGKFTVSLSYIPWGDEALAVMRDDALTPGKTVSGARETEVILDDTKTPNANIREALNIPKALGFASASEMNGLVVLGARMEARADVPETVDSQIRAHLQFTNLGIAARLGEKSGLVWAADITTGKVVKKAAVRIADGNGVTLWKGKTDDSGMAAVPGYDKLYGARFCIAESPEGASVLDLGTYFVPASAKEYEKIKDSRIPWRIHTVAQLPLYQPGQEVNAVLIARYHGDSGPDSGKGAQDDFADWKALPDTPVSLEVKDRKNTIVHAMEGVTDTYGALPFSFTLSPSAEPGWYRITAKRKNSEQESAVYAFQVVSFRPPDVKADITAPESQLVPAKGAASLAADVTAGYFSGTPVNGGAVDMEITEQESYFVPALLRGYRVGPEMWPYDPKYTPPRSTRLSGKLDAEGKTTLTLPAFAIQNSKPVTVLLTATVTDAARLATQGTASFLLHPSEYYVGLRTPFIALPNRDTPFEIKAATWDNKAVTGKTVSIRAERITWAKDEKKHALVWERSITLEKDTGDSFAASFAASGEYLVIATITDDAGRANIAVRRVYVPGPGGDWIRTKPGRRLEFMHEDTVYEPGKTALIVVKNPFDTATALVAIERDGILRSFVTEVSGEAPLIEIPLDKACAPYVYATITLVKRRTAPPPDASAPEGSADEGAPALAQGTLLLKVAEGREKLSVTVTSDKRAYRPGDTVKTNAVVTNGAGNGVKAQITFLAVDERYLRAAGERTLYDPSGTFGEQFPNAVQRTDLWLYILNRAVPVSLNTEKHMWAAMATASPPRVAQKMAGQSPAQQGEGADTPLRFNFTPLAFWLAAKETDDSGTLSTSFTLPDTITDYRIVAVACNTKSAFAVGEASVTVSKPLQILSALPKFVTEGDTLLAAVIVQNTGTTRGDATLSVKLSSGVPVALPEDTKTFALEAGEEGVRNFV
jgi:uncharacterized protein YfaS (alpha-2-macroglobulin family)